MKGYLESKYWLMMTLFCLFHREQRVTALFIGILSGLAVLITGVLSVSTHITFD